MNFPQNNTELFSNELHFAKGELEELRKLVSNFESYYETDEQWSLDDLDAQRELGFRIVQLLTKKL
jgi:hypothetical protein